MNFALIVIAVMLFLIADHLGVFSKNEMLLPILGFCAFAYFYPLIASGVAVVGGTLWGGPWLSNWFSVTERRMREFQPQINALFAKHGSPIPMDHMEEFRKLHYQMRHGTLDGYNSSYQEMEEVVQKQFDGDWSRYWAAWNNVDGK